MLEKGDLIGKMLRLRRSQSRHKGRIHLSIFQEGKGSVVEDIVLIIAAQQGEEVQPRFRRRRAKGAEMLAADLRRVRRDLQRPGIPMARRRGMWLAYDALLVQACAAVGITHELDSLGDGIDREAERMRIEEALCSAGMAIR